MSGWWDRTVVPLVGHGPASVVPLVGHSVVPLVGHEIELPGGGDVLSPRDWNKMPFVHGGDESRLFEAEKRAVRGRFSVAIPARRLSGAKADSAVVLAVVTADKQPQNIS